MNKVKVELIYEVRTVVSIPSMNKFAKFVDLGRATKLVRGILKDKLGRGWRIRFNMAQGFPERPPVRELRIPRECTDVEKFLKNKRALEKESRKHNIEFNGGRNVKKTRINAQRTEQIM